MIVNFCGCKFLDKLANYKMIEIIPVMTVIVFTKCIDFNHNTNVLYSRYY